MRIVTFSNLFPSDRQPRHGIFVQERLRHILAAENVQATVIALRPDWPLTRRQECENPLADMTTTPVNFQHVPSIPKLSNWIDPFTWANATEDSVRSVLKGDEDNCVLDAHFLYPDGVAATIVGRRLGIPVVVTARGSDVNVKCQNLVMRRWVLWSAHHSAATITVSAALRDKLIGYGLSPDKLHVIRNGVDRTRFYRESTLASKRHFGVSGSVILTVGHLLEEKGQRLVVGVLTRFPEVTLLIVGDGPDRKYLEWKAKELGVEDRIRFAGSIPHKDMRTAYSAADVTVLMSANEGLPNVVLESLACGTRVVATNVGGVPEIITDECAGIITTGRSVDALYSALGRIFSGVVDTSRTSSAAAALDWESSVKLQIALYRTVLERHKERS